MANPTRQAVGDARASNVDDADLELVAAITSLSPRAVAARCNKAHGNTRLRVVFADHWPTSAEDLGDLTIALARDAGLAPEIAAASELDSRQVEQRLQGVAGRTLVHNAFPELVQQEDGTEEPDEDGNNEDDEQEDDDPDDDRGEGRRNDEELVDLTDAALLGAVRGAAARRSPPLVRWLAPQIGWTFGRVTAALRKSHGNVLLANLFGDDWPSSLRPDSAPALGALRAAVARRSRPLVVWIARHTGKSADDVSRALAGSPGNTTLKNLFPLLSVSKPPRPPHPHPGDKARRRRGSAGEAPGWSRR